MQTKKSYSTTHKALAWSVHCFTASGIIFALLAIIAVSDKEFVDAVLYLGIAFIIDGVDGMFARKVKVKEVLPHFDGSSIDYVIDFTTYAVIPAFFFYEANLLPEDPTLKWIGLAAILLSSTFYYGKTTYVTEDFHFEGFPVMWNLTVFYLYFVFGFSPMYNLIVVIFLAILHFIPLKYPYPSQTREHKSLNWSFSILCFVVGGIAIFQYPDVQSWVKLLANIVIVYFTGMTIYKTFFYYKK